MSWLLSKIGTGGLILIYLLTLAVIAMFIPWTGTRTKEAADFATAENISEVEALKHYVMLPADSELSASLQSFMMFPDPASALQRYFETDMTRFVADSQSLQDDISVDLLQVFYSHLLYDHPELVVSFAERLSSDVSMDHAATGALMVAMSEHPERHNLIDKIVTQHVADETEGQLIRESLYEATFVCPHVMPESPAGIDYLWACYFASGQSLYLEKITWPLANHAGDQQDVFMRLQELSETIQSRNLGEYSAEYQQLIREATPFASWGSLRANANDYPFVKKDLLLIKDLSQKEVAEEISSIIK